MTGREELARVVSVQELRGLPVKGCPGSWDLMPRYAHPWISHQRASLARG